MGYKLTSICMYVIAILNLGVNVQEHDIMRTLVAGVFFIAAGAFTIADRLDKDDEDE